MANLPESKYFIISIAEEVDALMMSIEEMAAGMFDNNPLRQQLLPAVAEETKGFNPVTCAELAKAYYLNCLQETALWMEKAGTKQDYVVDQLGIMIPMWNDVDSKTQDDIVRFVEAAFAETANDNLVLFDGPDPNWRVWAARTLSTNALVLENVGDFRILDWERRMGLTEQAKEDGVEVSEDAWDVDEDMRTFAQLNSIRASKSTSVRLYAVDVLDHRKAKAQGRGSRIVARAVRHDL